MAKIPGQRKPGQTGGGGRHGQGGNRVRSGERGGNPYRGGGGTGKKPPGSGCLDVVIIGAGSLAAAGYGIYEAIRAVF